MNAEEINRHQLEPEACVICGNHVEPELGGIRTNHRGNTINLCGPECLQTFAKEPDAYLARLAKIMRVREPETEIACL